MGKCLHYSLCNIFIHSFSLLFSVGEKPKTGPAAKIWPGQFCWTGIMAGPFWLGLWLGHFGWAYGWVIDWPSQIFFQFGWANNGQAKNLAQP